MNKHLFIINGKRLVVEAENRLEATKKVKSELSFLDPMTIAMSYVKELNNG